ncbi:MAG: hypothetical protein AAFX08_01255 [Pseudomonadota bacterium]
MPVTTATNLRARAPSRPKRSPLAGWFGRKDDGADAGIQPIDASAGVSRALRLAARAQGGQAADAQRAEIRDALNAIEGALYTIDRIRDVIEQAYDVALSAQETGDAAARSLLAESYDDLRLEISRIAEEAAENGAVLVGRDKRQIDVRLGGQMQYSVTPIRLDASNKGLNLSPPREAFQDDEEVHAALSELDHALQRADRAAISYCRDARFLIARLELQTRLSA